MLQPKTGERCNCKPGIHRDNCGACEGTGWRIDFRAIHAAREAREAKPTAPALWTREEREAWKHGILGRIPDNETTILDVRSGEFLRILATVEALEKALDYFAETDMDGLQCVCDPEGGDCALCENRIKARALLAALDGEADGSVRSTVEGKP